jgi:hypothetical protein
MKGSRFSEEQIIGVLGVPGRFVEFYTLRPAWSGCPFGEKRRDQLCFPTISGNRARPKKPRMKTPWLPLSSGFS